ncbi:MAG: hypothetical protein K1X50_04055 [Candidatus Promineofilum sp.]|nr:hypothetical protein [Promineifilum sp.]
MTTTQAIRLLVVAINFWLAATGSPSRVAAADIVVTHRGGVWFLAFPELPADGAAAD